MYKSFGDVDLFAFRMLHDLLLNCILLVLVCLLLECLANSNTNAEASMNMQNGIMFDLTVDALEAGVRLQTSELSL